MLSRRSRRRLNQIISVILCATILAQSSPLPAWPYLRSRPVARATTAGLRPAPAATKRVDDVGAAPRTVPTPSAPAFQSARSTPQPGSSEARPLAVEAAFHLLPPPQTLPRSSSGFTIHRSQLTIDNSQLTINNSQSTSIPLLAGWNLISFPEEPANTDPAAVLSSIAGSYNLVYAYDGCDGDDPWKLYDPAAPPPASDLTAIDHRIGLWIEMTADATLDVAGTPPASTDIPLCEGWNLIGYPLDEARPVAEALSSIEGKYDLVFAYDPTDVADPWEVFEVGVPAWSNDLQVMGTGRGFWVHATEDVTLTIAKAEPTATPIPTPTATLTLPPAEGDPPTAEISSPDDGAEVTDFVDIVGTADDPDGDLVEYRLQYRQVGTTGTVSAAQRRLRAVALQQADAEWTTIAAGNTPVVNDVLGRLDPTLLLNGMFEIRLLAVDSEGQQTTASLHLVISGNQKIGHIALSFVDLDVPVAGLNITIIRRYDSRDKRIGDFGAGWTMQLVSMELAESGVPGEDWEQTAVGGLVPTYCLEPTQSHMVTVRLPNDEVHRFMPRITPHCQGLVPIRFARVDYVPLPGTTSSLQPLDGNDVVVIGTPGGAVELRNLDMTMYNPRSYRLTLRDGTAFNVDEFAGVQRITDRNGNQLDITPRSVTHSTGKSVAFQRDGLGRITRITDPPGNFLTYSYDANGDLVSVTDPEGNVTTFTYAAGHYLISAHNAQGDIPLQMQYDADGRLSSQTDAYGNTTTYQHDIANRREITTDRLGNITTYEYDARGNVTSITDPLGNVTTNSYDSQDRLTASTDSLGNTTSWTYDDQGNMTSVTDPLGNTTHYTYNQFGQVLSATDALGHTVNRTYDSKGNLTAHTNALGETTTFAYDAQGNMTAMVDAAGNTTSISYDSYGNPVSRVDPSGHETTFTYDANGNPLSTAMTVTTAAGVETISISNDYDTLGQMTGRTLPDGSRAEIAYTPLGQTAVITDPSGATYANAYDAMGRRTGLTLPDGLSLSSTYDAEGNTLTKSDLAGNVVQLAHDPAGRITQVTTPGGASTTLSYDAAGQQTGFTDENGNTTTVLYDAAGRQVASNRAGALTQYGYDAAGNLTSITDPNGNTTNFEYDAAGRVTRIVYPDGSAVSMTYDALGRKSSETDPLGHTTHFAYDGRSLLTEVTDALGGVTRYTYDERGNLLSITDALGRVTRLAYDTMGRLVRRTLPSGDFETFAYDARGRQIAHTDFNGQTVRFTYDVRDRMTSKTLPDGTTIRYTYTAGGQTASVTDATGTTTFAYDDRQRVTQVTYPDGSTVGYTYDATGNLLARITSSGTVSYTYDAQDRLTSVIAPDGSVTSYTYDGVGKVTGVSYPNGTTTAYTYDTMNRLTELVNRRSDGTAFSSYRYTYDAAGNRTSVEELDGTTISYTYDALNRLTREHKSAGDGSTIYDIRYTYDAVGNRLTKQEISAGAQAGQGSQTTTYTYDSNDRLLQETPDAAAPIVYTYDANGNLLTRTDGNGTNTFAYDAENRLTRATIAADVIEYVYNGLGLRVGKTRNGNETRYLVDTTPAYSQVLEERDGTGTVTASYVLGHGQIAMAAGGSTSYYHYDGLGSVRQLTDATQNLTDSYDYDAFGTLLDHTGSSANPYLYTSAQFDPVPGLYFLRSRYYDPAQGRFLSRDGFASVANDPATLHKYAYVGNNPVNRVDPGGTFSLVETTIVSAIISTLAVMEAFAGMTVMFHLVVPGSTPNFLQPPADASRVALSASLSAGITALASVGGTAGLEMLYFNTKGWKGPELYAYLGGTLSLGMGSSSPFAVEVGHVLQCKGGPSCYEGWAMSLSGSAVLGYRIPGLNLSIFGGPALNVDQERAHGYGVWIPFGGRAWSLTYAITYYWHMPGLNAFLSEYFLTYAPMLFLVKALEFEADSLNNGSIYWQWISSAGNALSGMPRISSVGYSQQWVNEYGY